MISGCVIPSSAIVNSGSLSTMYLGSVLSNSHVSAQRDSVNTEKSSSSDVHHLGDVTADAFSTTLFPVSTVFNSCFRHQSASADSTVCQSAVLTFGAGNQCCSVIFSIIICYYAHFSTAVR